MRVPDYNAALNQLKAGTADAWVAPAEIGEKTAKDSGGKVALAAKQLELGADGLRGRHGNTALRDGAEQGAGQVIKDGTWTKLQEQYYPGRPVPEDFKPGSGTVAVAAGRRPTAAELTSADGHPEHPAGDLLRPRRMRQALPELLAVGLPNTLLLASPRP